MTTTDASQVRINELARELEVMAKAIIDLLPGLGVTEKKTHSSSIPVDVAEKIRRQLQGTPEPEPAVKEPPRPAAPLARPPAPAQAPPTAPVAATPSAPAAPAPHRPPVAPAP